MIDERYDGSIEIIFNPIEYTIELNNTAFVGGLFKIMFDEKELLINAPVFRFSSGYKLSPDELLKKLSGTIGIKTIRGIFKSF